MAPARSCPKVPSISVAATSLVAPRGLELEAWSRLGDRHLLLVHVCTDGCEQGSGQVSLTGVCQHGHQNRPLWSLLGHLNRGIHGGTSRNSSEDSLGLGQHLAHPNGSITWDWHIFIIASGCNALLRNEWDEVRCPALDGVWLKGRVGSGGAAVIVAFALGARLDQWSVRRLAQADLDAGTFLLQRLPSTDKVPPLP